MRVHRVVCAIDYGWTINPDTIEAQAEGGIVFGLSAALNQEITIGDGRVEQSNFHDYPMLRMGEVPEVEVHIMPSTEEPGGVGEATTPAIAPAVANAIFAATAHAYAACPFEQATWGRLRRPARSPARFTTRVLHPATVPVSRGATLLARIATQLRGLLETQIQANPDSRTGRWESRRVLVLRIQRIVDRTPERAICRGLVPHRRCDEGIT